MLTRLRAAAEREEGFTLVELLVAMLVLSIVGAAAVSALGQGVRASARGQARGDALMDLQLVAQRMSREIRAANPILIAEASRIEVQIVRAGQTRQYRYELAAMPAPATRNRLHEVRVVGANSDTFVLGEEFEAGGLALSYADGVGNALTTLPLSPGDRARVKTVTITLTRFTPMNPAPMTVSTTVSVRNNA